MPGKKTPAKRKTKAGSAAHAGSKRDAPSTAKARSTETLLEPTPITQRDFEILEYAKAMGFFDEQRYEVARPLFLQLAAAGNGDIAHTALMRLRMCEQRLAAASLKDK
jgi:hypothetical protein